MLAEILSREIGHYEGVRLTEQHQIYLTSDVRRIVKQYNALHPEQKYRWQIRWEGGSAKVLIRPW